MTSLGNLQLEPTIIRKNSQKKKCFAHVIVG